MTDELLDLKRMMIADLDREIMTLLRRRLDCVIEIGRYKAEHGMEVHNPAVEQKVVDRYRGLAEELGMDPEIAERICRTVMEESIANENAVKDR